MENLQALMKEHNQLADQFNRGFVLPCKCSKDNASFYVNERAEALCDICHLLLKNKSSYSIDNINSFKINPQHLYQLLTQAQDNYFLKSIQQQFNNRIKQLQEMKQAARSSLSQNHKVRQSTFKILKKLLDTRQLFLRTETPQQKLELIPELKKINWHIEQQFKLLDQQSEFKRTKTVRDQITLKFKDMERIIKDIEDIVFGIKAIQSPKYDKLKTLDSVDRTKLKNNKVFPTEKIITDKLLRFRMERNRGWLHNKNSVDAISFVPNVSLYLKGFIQYQIVDWYKQSEVQIQVSLVQNQNLYLYNNRMILTERMCKSRKFQISFLKKILVKEGEQFDLCLKNYSNKFKTKCGYGPVQSKYVRFKRSIFDNNNTNVEEGQFYALLIERAKDID